MEVKQPSYQPGVEQDRDKLSIINQDKLTRRVFTMNRRIRLDFRPNRWTFLLAWVCLISTTVQGYSVTLDETDNTIGQVVFNASLGHGWTYRLDGERTSNTAQKFVSVDRLDGTVTLKKVIPCEDIEDKQSEALSFMGMPISSLPAAIINPLTRTPKFTLVLYVECRSFRLSGSETDYISIPVVVNCRKKGTKGTVQSGAQHSTTVVSVTATVDHLSWTSKIGLEGDNETAMKNSLEDDSVCLRRSQLVIHVGGLLPESVKRGCDVTYGTPSNGDYAVEKQGGDLVAKRDICIHYGQWVVSVPFMVECPDTNQTRNVKTKQNLEILFHVPGTNNELNPVPEGTRIRRRGRREMRNMPPYFDRAVYVVRVPEEKEKGYVVTTMTAKDPNNDELHYSLHAVLDARSQNQFSIDSVSGVVTTTVSLNREFMDVHFLRVTAEDNGTPPRSGTTTLQINVSDENDHPPSFERATYEATIRESAPIGSTVVTVRATDQDFGANAQIEYSFLNPGAPNDVYRIDPKSGIITTRDTLDRETSAYYSLIVQASDMGPVAGRKSTSATVEVTVLDDNDNYPQFTERAYTVEVPEDINWLKNPTIASVRAYDDDEGINAALRYSLIGGNTQGHFAMDSLTGDISVLSPLDYEAARSYRLVVRAQDGGSPSRSNTTQVLVKVTDVNDNDPKFYTSLFQESVMENVPEGHSIVRVQAYDADDGVNSEIDYSLLSVNAAGATVDPNSIPVTVDKETGWIITTRELDREQGSFYDFTVLATDRGHPSRSASASVIIRVQDLNDNDPVFEPKIYYAVVSEIDPPGTPLITVTATDKDENSRLIYQLTNGNVRGRFNIVSQNGKGLISVGQPLDYKVEKKFVLTATATDSGGRSDTATVYVNITDANTHRPVFEKTPYTASVPEDSAIGTTVLVVEASDGDVGANARITYTMDDVPEFRIDPATGALVTTRALDREAAAGYTIVVTAQDNGKPPLSDTTNVEVEVSDVNDNPPEFQDASYSSAISEDALVGTSVLQLQALDKDLGLNGQIRYTFTGGADGDGAFSVDPTSGIIRTNRVLDRESVPIHHLIAYAVDRGGPALSSSVSVTVYVEDINDNPPRFESDKLKLYVPENSPIGWTVGEIKAVDPDEGPNGEVQYSIVGGQDADAFSLISRPGEPAELTIRVDTDYESAKKKYSVIVRASSAPLRNDVDVEIWVTDVNDNAPVLKDFTIVFNNYKNYFPVGPIGRVPAFDADVTDNLRYRVVSGNKANLLHVNESSGEITLSPSLNTNVPIHAVMEVSVFDGTNEVLAQAQLEVRLVTEAMLFNSVTVRLNQTTLTSFLSPLFDFFVEGIAAIVPCPKENVFVFNVQDDTDVDADRILNVSFSARRVGSRDMEDFYSPQFMQERVYLNRAVLTKLTGLEVLPFDDNLCVREPCVNFEECLSVLKFGNASGFVASDTLLFRPIYPVNTFACRCPLGFTGMNHKYECDTEVNLCYSSPCGGNGTCLRKESGYTCQCKEGFTGKNCEVNLWEDSCIPGLCRGDSQCATHPDSIDGGQLSCENCTYSSWSTKLCELRARTFYRGTFLTFPSIKQRHRLSIKLRFATREKNALLLYNGRYNDQHDFIALEIVDSQVVFLYSLGVNITKVKAFVAGGVSDGQWHEVEISYLNRTAILSVDNCDTALAIKYSELLPNYKCANTNSFHLEPRCADLMQTCYRFLDLTGPLQLGGLPSLPTEFPVTSHNFVGCIMDLQIDHELIDLNGFVANNGTIPGCVQKRGFCSSNPCKNGGNCQEGWGSFICVCPLGFGGIDCSEGIEPVKHFAGNSFLILTPHLRPVQLPWINSLSFRTRKHEGLLMKVQLGQTGTVIFQISGGHIVYRYNDIKAVLSEVTVNDGKWHHIEAKWMGSDVWLSLDYGQYELTKEMDVNIRGTFVGKVSLGGLEAEESSDDYGMVPGFDGCIQAVQIGSSKESWLRPTVESNVKDGCYSVNPCLSSPCPIHSACKDLWGDYQCECHPGYVGTQCLPVCQLNPCSESSVCHLDDLYQSHKKGYHCSCDSLHSGDYCEDALDQPCPSNWWGYPICGPCNCDVDKGYDADCNKTTGECECEENHYQPLSSDICFDCDCYATGSFSNRCDLITGQCRCRNGVIGRRCDSCSNPFAEVTLRGCEVIYDGCPRSFEDAIWWDRTLFDQEAIHSCPRGSVGKAFRFCERESGWGPPNLFNCTSETFLELATQLNILDRNKLPLSTYMAIKLSAELRSATNTTSPMYGRDVLIVGRLLHHILRYETRQDGLNLTHRQDRDFISNLVEVASTILEPKFLNNWETIVSLTGYGPEHLMLLFEKYGRTLAKNQFDTFTEPFEITAKNLIFGVDTVSPTDMWSYISSVSDVNGTSLIMDEHEPSEFLDSSLKEDNTVPGVIIPKYNNYPIRQRYHDDVTKVVLPLSEIGIRPGGSFKTPSAMDKDKAVIAYSIYPTLGKLLPLVYDLSIRHRFGIPVKPNSPLISLVIQPVNHTSSLSKNLLQNIRLRFPLLQQSGFTSPQCAFWDFAGTSPRGKWSTVGCQVEAEGTYISESSKIPYINCSCGHLTSFALLMDETDREYIADESTTQDIVSYLGIGISLLMLSLTFIAFCILRGLQTNSNTIHKNLVMAIFLAQLLFLIALKARKALVKQEFPCKILAIFLHYFFLCIFSWMLLEGIHLYRMLTEMRDINHGQMRFYYSIGYGAPAIVVGLSVGVRADQYGNYYFCWLSIYESVVWSLVGPICVVVLINLAVFAMAMRASVQIKESVTDFGNLRTLLWLGIVLLPILGSTWVLAVLSVNESLEILHFAFSISCLVEGVYVFIGYCIINRKVRQQLVLTWARLRGKKVPYDESLSGTRTTITSRSALAYNNSSFDVLHRNVGISTSSTTSRSTTKTSSSPYRSDSHLRNTSTSTSAAGGRSVPDTRSRHGRKKRAYFYKARKNKEEDPDTGEASQHRHGESDSDSEMSVDHASLDLASSHSSDEEECERLEESNLGTLRALPEITSKPNIVEEAENSQAQLLQGFNVPTLPPPSGNLSVNIAPYPTYTSYWSVPTNPTTTGTTPPSLFSASSPYQRIARAAAAASGQNVVRTGSPCESLSSLRLGLTSTPRDRQPLAWSKENLADPNNMLPKRNLPDVSLPLARRTSPPLQDESPSPNENIPVPERGDSLPSNSQEHLYSTANQVLSQRMVIPPMTTTEVSSESEVSNETSV